jgi:hypothetical protein
MPLCPSNPDDVMGIMYGLGITSDILSGALQRLEVWGSAEDSPQVHVRTWNPVTDYL